jgi:hypothetical protein
MDAQAHYKYSSFLLAGKNFSIMGKYTNLMGLEHKIHSAA